MQLTRVSSDRGGALVKLLVFLVIFGGVLTFAWIFFMPMLLTSTLERRTGFKVTVERLALNPFSASVGVSGLLINNPSSFPRTDYVWVRSFEARAPVKTLFSERPEFDSVRIDISHIAFVRNQEGTLNATLFYDRLFPVEKPAAEPEDAGKKAPAHPAPKAKQPTPPPEPQRPRPKPMAFLIRHLELKLDRVTVDDRAARGSTPRDFTLGINQTFENVTGAKQLMTPAMLKAISPVGTVIGGLIPGDLGKVLSAAADAGDQKPVKDELKSITETLEESRKP